MKNFFVIFFSILLLYLYVHNPILLPLRGMGAIKLLYILVPFVIFSSYSQYSSFFKKYSKEFNILLITYLFISFRTLMGPDESNFLYTGIVLIIEEFFVALSLALFLFHYKFSYKDFVRILLILASVGAVISTACVIFPPVNNFVRSSVILIEENSFQATAMFRNFGISDELTYSYGIIQGFLLSLGLFYIKDNKWFVPFMPFVALSIMVNARTGFLIVILGVILYLFARKVKRSIALFLFIGVIVTYLLPVVLGSMDSETVGWMGEFFDELMAMSRKDQMGETTFYGTLFGRMVILPNDAFEWLWGRGYYMFGRSDGHNTDVGWFLQLNLGGIIYIGLLFSLIKALFKKLKLAGMEKSVLLLIAGTIIIANTKGDFLYNSGGFRMLLLFMFFSCLVYNRRIA